MNGVDGLRCALVGGSHRTPVRTSRRRLSPSACFWFLPLVICGLVQAGDPPPVVVDSIEPAEIVQGQVPQPEIQVFGSNFIEGLPSEVNRPTVTLRQPGKGGAEFSALAWVNFAGTVATVPADMMNLLTAPLGVYDVIVTRPTDNASGTLQGAFTVTDGEPGPGEIALVVRSAWGGPVNDVEVVGNYAYAAIGRRLVILDVSDATNLVEVGSLNIMPGVRGVTVRDGYAFLAATNPYRFAVADVSDPTNPTLVWAGQGQQFSRDVQLYGNLAYVVGFGAVSVFDIGDVPNVVPLGELPVGSSNVATIIVGDLLYVGTSILCCEPILRIYDLASDPLNPVLLGSVGSAGERTTALAIQGDYAYWVMGHGASLSSLNVVDISNPASPTIVDTQFGFVWARDVAVSGGYAYVADSTRFSNQYNLNDWALTKGLAIFDLADPANPELVATFKTHGNVTGVEIVGNRAYVHDDGEGLIIVDVTDPTKPLRLGNYHSPSVLRQMGKKGDLLYIADAWNGFTVLDVADGAHPEVVSVYLADHYNNRGVNAFGIVLRDNLVYMGAGHLGLEVVDVDDPANPAFLGAFRVPPAEDPRSTFDGIALSGDIAHIGFSQRPNCQGLGKGWFFTFDVSDPQSIVDLGQIELSCYFGPRTIELNDQSMAFVAHDGGVGIDDNTDLTLDVFDPANPTVIYDGQIPAVADVALDVDRKILYLASDEPSPQQAVSGLYIQDVTDPANPVLLAHVGQDDPLGDGIKLNDAFAVAAQNQRVYVVGRGTFPAEGGIQLVYLFDVSDPTLPVHLDVVKYVGGSRSSVFVDGPEVYVANEFGGGPQAGLVLLELVGLNPVGDLDGDGTVGVKDLLILLGNWGPCADCKLPGDCPADLNDDCSVGVADLLILLGNWG